MLIRSFQPGLFSVFAFLIFIHNINGQTLTGKTVTIDTNCNGFYEYLPSEYDKGNKKYPLLIFLHGMGELGNGSSDLSKILRNGPLKLIKDSIFPDGFHAGDSLFQFIIFAPQFIHWPWPGTVNTIMEYVLSHYHVDERRIYLTGLSMGGGVAWEYAGSNNKSAEKLAALVPICGASLANNEKVSRIVATKLPVWAIHNEGDPVVTVEYTKKYISLINELGGTSHQDIKETIFPVTGHNAWTKSYDPEFRENGMNIYEWMLSHHR